MMSSRVGRGARHLVVLVVGCLRREGLDASQHALREFWHLRAPVGDGVRPVSFRNDAAAVAGGNTVRAQGREGGGKGGRPAAGGGNCGAKSKVSGVAEILALRCNFGQ